MSPTKLFIFICTSTGDTQYSNDKICNFWEPHRPISVFFSYRIPEKPTRKARLKDYGESPYPVFNSEKVTFEPKRTSAEAYCRIFTFLSIQAVITT